MSSADPGEELALLLAGRAVAIVSCFRLRETLAGEGVVYFPSQYALELARHCPVLWVNPPGRRPRRASRCGAVEVVDVVGRPRDDGFFGRVEWVQARRRLRRFRRSHRERELLLLTFSTVLPELEPSGGVRRVGFVGDSFLPLEHPYLGACELLVCSSQGHAELIAARSDLPRALQLSMGVTKSYLEQAERARGSGSGRLRVLFAEPERPLVAYFGMLRRADVALLAELARRRPHVNLCCAGTLGDEADPHYGGALDFPNVRFLPRYRHDEMAELVGDADVGLVAYAVDEFNLGAAPTKLFEYFALGLPVVSTPLAYPPRDERLVAIARDADELVAAVDAALDAPGDPEQRIAAAATSTPEHRLLELLRALG